MKAKFSLNGQYSIKCRKHREPVYKYQCETGDKDVYGTFVAVLPTVDEDMHVLHHPFLEELDLCLSAVEAIQALFIFGYAEVTAKGCRG